MDKKIIKQEERKQSVAKNYEIAKELGIDKGDLPSRVIGYYGGAIGGLMTRRLIEMGEKNLINKK
ncbi:small, acid-soluble spore protein, alpha/beta type [Natronincola ferrireducens]|uniref:Small, acid-soluble spore protein, alpha/beta type n=1 Tax=Natronincola ferrireducens TaxID=393762 RepID=A0A1G9E202_9FIRM|nr:small, acid-soluble spore protein, alpha/beta type [Natronincola ferrireducens]SDK70144.1 Small, acid-soluble spore protein, alpha/beta type [Natronincola ferrireducens]